MRARKRVESPDAHACMHVKVGGRGNKWKAHLQALCYAVSELVRRLQLLPVFMHDEGSQALQLHVTHTHVSLVVSACAAMQGPLNIVQQATFDDISNGESKICVDQT